jgi:hypothetical protein
VYAIHAGSKFLLLLGREVRSIALDMRTLFIHDCARHLAICRRCQSRLKSWTKLLSEFDRKTFARQGRADA